MFLYLNTSELYFETFLSWPRCSGFKQLDFNVRTLSLLVESRRNIFQQLCYCFYLGSHLLFIYFYEKFYATCVYFLRFSKNSYKFIVYLIIWKLKLEFFVSFKYSTFIPCNVLPVHSVSNVSDGTVRIWLMLISIEDVRSIVFVLWQMTSDECIQIMFFFHSSVW